MEVKNLKIPELGHIGLVVDNVENYDNLLSDKLGMREFDIYYFEPSIARVNGEKIESFKLKIAISEFINKVKIELIQPIIDGGFFSEYLKRNGNGINHLAFYVQDIKKWREYFLENGCKIFYEAIAQDEIRGKRQVFYTKINDLNYYYEFAQLSQ
ncbi:MAG: VOC family protein [Candidatus Lokiarchaeota archaeon]|nr:VOC family protein [Candidatus Lokiarchaeota archaeon]